MRSYFFFKNHQKEMRSHPALKKSALPQPSGDGKEEVMMKLAIQTPQEEYAKNTEIISACIDIIKIRIPALDECSQWIDNLVVYKCALDLKASLLKLAYTSLTKEKILKAKEEINRMINLLGPTEEESSTVHRISKQYRRQCHILLCELKDLVEMPLFTCWRSNSAIARSCLI